MGQEDRFLSMWREKHMAQKQLWYRSNRVLIGFLPFLVLGLAYAQTSLNGTAQNVTQLVLVLALFAFMWRVGRNAREGQE
jgi:hypothetical protein